MLAIGGPAAGSYIEIARDTRSVRVGVPLPISVSLRRDDSPYPSGPTHETITYVRRQTAELGEILVPENFTRRQVVRELFDFYAQHRG